MKPWEIALTVGGVGLLGYLIYKSRDKFVKPLDQNDNAPLLASMDAGQTVLPEKTTHTTEYERPATDPVLIATPEPIREPAYEPIITSGNIFDNAKEILQDKPTFFEQVQAALTPEPSPTMFDDATAILNPEPKPTLFSQGLSILNIAPAPAPAPEPYYAPSSGGTDDVNYSSDRQFKIMDADSQQLMQSY